MTIPGGRVVGNESLLRKCGHRERFAHYERDPFLAGRRAKFQATLCQTCAAAAVASNNQRQAATAGGPKGPALLRLLPVGFVFHLTRTTATSWTAEAGLDEDLVHGTGRNPRHLLHKLARIWMKTTNHGPGLAPGAGPAGGTSGNGAPPVG